MLVPEKNPDSGRLFHTVGSYGNGAGPREGSYGNGAGPREGSYGNGAGPREGSYGKCWTSNQKPI